MIGIKLKKIIFVNKKVTFYVKFFLREFTTGLTINL